MCIYIGSWTVDYRIRLVANDLGRVHLLFLSRHRLV